MDKLIIELRANEYMMRDINPHVPWSAGELARDAEAAQAAGAAMIHFHARRPDGGPAHDYESYREAVSAIRRASDLILHPTLGQITVQGDAARTDHILRLAADGLKPEYASVDLGSTNIDIWDAARGAYGSLDRTYVNATGSLIAIVEALRSVGVRPALACWSIPFLRTLEPFFRMGLVEEPAWVILIHTGGGQLGGHPPTPAGLRAFLDHLPERRLHWTVMSKPGNLFANAAQAIAQGGHVSIGIGDHTYAEMGAPTNAELVRRIVELAHAVGREVATPAEARAMLGLG